MPLYEYRCADCEERFEILQRMGEGADGLQCPQCGQAHLEKQCSTFAASSGTASSSGSVAGLGGGCAGGGAGFT